MRYLVYLLAIVLMALSPIGVHAEEINEITLTVSSDGPTKDEAVKNALRLAIEQAYGAFVSANTTILNDELVKDEIVTITHGAIKEFKEVAAAQLSDNRYSITVQATVSLPNLITYAKNHGSECEFAGNTFGMQMKIYELQKQNELKALENLRESMKPMIAAAMHWEIEVGEPKVDSQEGDFDFWQFNYVFSRDKDKKFTIQKDVYSSKIDIGFAEKIAKMRREDFYLVPVTIYASVFDGTYDSEGNPNEPLYNYINKTLSAISLTQEERSAAEAKGLPITSMDWGYHSAECEISGNHLLGTSSYFFRNTEAEQIIYDMYDIIGLNALNFAIEDNLGKKHRCYFYVDGRTYSSYSGSCNRNIDYLGELLPNDVDFHTIAEKEWQLYRIIDTDDELFSWPTSSNGQNVISYNMPGVYYHSCKISTRLEVPHALQHCVAKFRMRIPKNEIGKYSSFKVVRDIEM